MNEDRILLPEGKALIKFYEKLRLQSYQDEGGVWTVGWGHALRVLPGTEITLEQAEALFEEDCGKFIKDVKRVLCVPIDDYQFSALVSFTFNLGLGSLVKSTLLRFVNSAQFFQAAEEFPRWCHIKGVPSSGLLARRKAEQALFLSNLSKTPSPKNLG